MHISKSTQKKYNRNHKNSELGGGNAFFLPQLEQQEAVSADIKGRRD
jgi:hypothetical protein